MGWKLQVQVHVQVQLKSPDPNLFTLVLLKFFRSTRSSSQVQASVQIIYVIHFRYLKRLYFNILFMSLCTVGPIPVGNPRFLVLEDGGSHLYTLEVYHNHLLSLLSSTLGALIDSEKNVRRKIARATAVDELNTVPLSTLIAIMEAVAPRAISV